MDIWKILGIKGLAGGGGGVTVESLSVTENGDYTAPTGKAYSPVEVTVPQTTVTSLPVTENGTYTAPTGTAYSPVTVNVPVGLVYETGTYTPAEDIDRPTISFENTHSTIPVCIVMTDSTGTEYTTNDTNFGFVYGSLEALGGTKSPNMLNGRYDICVYEYKGSGNPTQAAYGITNDTGSESASYRGYWVTNAAFYPSTNSTTRYWRSGRTYKWIAVWKPAT